jgi:hypothetical protein
MDAKRLSSLLVDGFATSSLVNTVDVVTNSTTCAVDRLGYPTGPTSCSAATMDVLKTKNGRER